MKLIPVVCQKCAATLKIKIPTGRRVPPEIKCPKCGTMTPVTEDAAVEEGMMAAPPTPMPPPEAAASPAPPPEPVAPAEGAEAPSPVPMTVSVPEARPATASAPSPSPTETPSTPDASEAPPPVKAPTPPPEPARTAARDAAAEAKLVREVEALHTMVRQTLAENASAAQRTADLDQRIQALEERSTELESVAQSIVDFQNDVEKRVSTIEAILRVAAVEIRGGVAAEEKKLEALRSLLISLSAGLPASPRAKPNAAGDAASS